MEIIRISGYTEDEKKEIAKRYLIPKQFKAAGIALGALTITEEALEELIRYYTREAGVRGLEREISKCCRKTIKQLLLNEIVFPLCLDKQAIEPLLGPQRYRYGNAESVDQIGQVTGLAWTEAGGDVLTIEAMSMAGKGKVICTGKLGEVMQESIQAAMSVVRNRSRAYQVPANFYEKNDIHVHVPEGATPKDGPSAGIAVCTALLSLVTSIPVRKELAMTGEITLRGHVLPIGGLKEKLLAARRAGIKAVVFPKENERDLTEFSPEVYRGMTLYPVQSIDEVLKLALMPVGS